MSPRADRPCVVAALALLAAACDGNAEGQRQAGLTRLVADPARLVGDGPTSCTNAPAAAGAGSHWCAFSRLGANANTELWVVEVSASRATIACDGTDPRCRRLTEALWTGEPDEGPAHPWSHRFDGDTLIFHAEAPRPGLYDGPVWAWRPGWPAAQRLTGDHGIGCAAHERAATAICVENFSADARGMTFDVTAAPLAPGAGPARTLVRIAPASAAGAVAWRSAFSPDGAHFALSFVDGSGMEVLRTVPTAALGTTPIAQWPVLSTGGGSWRISRDGQKVYALRTSTGVLSMIDFPAGGNAVTLAERVVAFDVLGDPEVAVDQGLGLFTDPRGDLTTFRVLRDRTRPTDAVPIADAVVDAVVSPDVRFVHLTRATDALGRFQNATIARTDGGGGCPLNDEHGRAGFAPTFLASAGMILWAQDSDAGGDQVDGWLASPAGCAGRSRFARNIGLIAPVGDRGVVYGDEVSDELVTLRYASVEGGVTWPASGGQVLHRNADIVIGGLVGAMESDVVFQVVKGPAEERGIFVYGPLQ